ncbi:MAG: hypothetical protein OQL11_02145 [Gammaproteobacteria bacterium]|nr:hypothetical protein [Gammaproteobacteria bacterium]
MTTFARILLAFCLLVAGLAAQAEEEVTVGFPKAGTRLVFDRTLGDERETITWIVIDETAHRGRTVLRLISDAGFEFYDAETKSWVATMLHDRLQEVSPHNGQLSSPLWVGKSWEARFLYRRRDGSQTEQHRTWTVEARETVSVPAGSFDCFRIRSQGEALTITLWYAPELDFYVRRLTEGMVQAEQVLVDYRLP